MKLKFEALVTMHIQHMHSISFKMLTESSTACVSAQAKSRMRHASTKGCATDATGNAKPKSLRERARAYT